MPPEDRHVKLFKVKDLMVTVLPDVDLAGADASTVGNCTPEHDRQCDLSLDVMEMTPYVYVDPVYLEELRRQLEHALARSKVVVPNGADVKELEQSMRPRRPEEIDMLEKKLTEALEELAKQRAEVEAFVEQNPGWSAGRRESPQEP